MCPMLLGEKDRTTLTFVYSNCYLLPFWSFLASLAFKFWGILMTPSKSRFQSFELDFAKSSHVLLAWWWLRSHRFYFQFLGGMIHFSCTSFAKCVVQPSTFRFEVGAREEAFCICNRADDRSWILTRICRWCWTYWWRNCSCLRSDGSGIFLGALSWIYFLLNDFLQVENFENLEVKKKMNPSIVLQWNRLLTKTELPKSSCFSF